LIKLILGLYEPTEGKILVNGINMKKLNKESYFKMFATVFQDFIKYPFNVYENIGIGLIENIDSYKEIEQAAILSDIDSIIQRLPCKYNTKLQREWNEAVDLSHGQWQRIALSRAFLNKNANSVVMLNSYYNNNLIASSHGFFLKKGITNFVRCSDDTNGVNLTPSATS